MANPGKLPYLSLFLGERGRVYPDQSLLFLHRKDVNYKTLAIRSSCLEQNMALTLLKSKKVFTKHYREGQYFRRENYKINFIQNYVIFLTSPIRKIQFCFNLHED